MKTLDVAVARAAEDELKYPAFVRISNISQTLEHLEEAFWIYTLDERGVEVYDHVEYSGPTAVVLPAKEESCSKALKNKPATALEEIVSGHASSRKLAFT